MIGWIAVEAKRTAGLVVRRDRGLIVTLAVALGASIALSAPGCAHRGSPAASSNGPAPEAAGLAPIPAAYGRTRTLEGPRCATEGPTATATLSCCSPGKPPSEHASVDFVIRNPLPHPVWFVWEPIPGTGAEYDAQVTEVLVSHVSDDRPAYVWEFLPNVIQALRLASGAQVTLRELRVDIFHRPTRVTFAFAEEIRVGGVPAAGWLGAAGYTESVEIFQPGEHDFMERQRTDPRPEGADLDIRVQCAVSVDVPSR
jgi:hypothetical protein